MEFTIHLTEEELLELIASIDRQQAWSGYDATRSSIWLKAMDHLGKCRAVPTYLLSQSEELPYLQAIEEAENFSEEDMA